MIGFALTEEQVATQKWAHEFAEKEIRPVAPQYDETEEFPWPVCREGARDRAVRPGVLPDGRRGRDRPDVRRSCRGDAAGAAPASRSASSAPACRWPASRPAARRSSSPSGRRGCSSTTAAPGSARSASPSRAPAPTSRRCAPRPTRDGGWVLNGTKVFITNGGIADVHIVVATVDPSLGHRGQATFVIRPGTPGLRQGKKEKKLGIRASHTAEVLLEDCRIPDDCLLGGGEAPGQAGAAARPVDAGDRRHRPADDLPTRSPARCRRSRRPGRSSARRRSASRGRRSSSPATTRRSGSQFGRPIISNQGIAFKLADMAMEIDCAPGCSSGARRGWAAPACRSSTPRAPCPSSRPARSP